MREDALREARYPRHTGSPPCPPLLMEASMTRLVRPALIALAALAAPLAARAEGPDAAKLAGHWTGQGRFYDADVQKRHGSIPFDLSVSPDLVLSGTVGGAAIRPARGKRHRQQVDFELLLTGDVLPGADFKKDHLVLVITGATGEAVSGDFHLKSNFIFDLTMRPGALELRRAPERREEARRDRRPPYVSGSPSQ